MKNILLILLITISNTWADTIDDYLGEYKREMIKSHYSKAIELLIKAQNISPNDERVIDKMKKFQIIMKLKNEIGNSIEVIVPQYVKDYEERMKFNQKWYNPSASDTVIGFLLIAGGIAGASKLQSWIDKQDQISISNFHDSPSLHITIKNGGWLNTTVENFTIQIKGDDSYTSYIDKTESTEDFFSSSYMHFDNLPKGKYKMIVNGSDSHRNIVFSFTHNIYFEANSRECKVIDIKTKDIYSSTCIEN